MEGFKLEEPKPWEPTEYDSNISENEEDQEEEEEDTQSDISLSESDISEREINIKSKTKRSVKPHILKGKQDYKEILEEDLFFFPEDIIYG